MEAPRSKALALALLALAIASLIPAASAASSDFKLVSYSYTSSANEHVIYPGSKNVELVVTTKYVGSSPAYRVSACISLPSGFYISRGHFTCSPPYRPNGSVYTVVEPNSVVIFRFYFDVGRSVSPGTYDAQISISYVENNTAKSEQLTVRITVSPYPRINLKVVEWYWRPDAYPGSEGVTLNIVLRNEGGSAIQSAELLFRLPPVFVPREVHARIGSVPKNQTVTVSLSNIDVYPNASPNTPYPIEMVVNATARTDDGVTYVGHEDTTFAVEVHTPPTVWLHVVDYGLANTRSVRGLRQARIYVVFQLKSFESIEAMTAVFNVTAGARFINGSRVGVVTVSRAYRYGNYITIESPPLDIGNGTRILNFTLELTIFGSRNGAEFWRQERFNFSIRVGAPSIDVELVKAYWSPPQVYPGTAGASLNVVLQDMDSVNLESAVVELKLPPRVFSPSTLVVSGVSIASGSRTTVVFRGIDVSPTAAPGPYIATVVVDGIARGRGGFYRVHLVLHTTVFVSTPYASIFKPLYASWSGTRFYTTSVGQRLSIGLLVSRPATIEGGYVEIHLPPQLILESGEHSKNVSLERGAGYGSVLRLALGPIDSATNTPGTYPVVLEIHALVSIHGADTWINRCIAIPLRVLRPVANISVVYAGWSGGLETSLARGATALIEMLSRQVDTVRTIIANITLVEGARFLDGRRSAVWVYQGALGYGSVVTARVGNIVINATNASVEALLHVCIYAELGGGYYHACRELSLRIPLTHVEELAVSYTETLMNGVYAPILPTARGVVLRIHLINVGTHTISSMSPRVSLPRGFELRRVTGTCLSTGVAPGASCYIDLELSVVNASPGTYVANVSLRYVMRVGSSNAVETQRFSVPLVVASPRSYVPELRTLEAFWGRAQPETVYPHERMVPLTLVVMNPGRYSVQGVWIGVEPLNRSVSMVSSRAFCAQTLAPEAVCRATLYADLANVSRSGHLLFRIALHYTFTSFGTHIPETVYYTVTLRISRFAGSNELKIVESGWVGVYAVYPDTHNATYSITVANLWPYRVGGVEITITLPPGFSHNGSRTVHIYVAGPIESLQTFTTRFTVSIASIRAGRYVANVTLRYILFVGGAQLSVTQHESISLVVHSIEWGIKLGYLPNVGLVTWFWGSARPIVVQGYAKHVPLTIVLLNRGQVAASGVWIEVRSLNKSVVVEVRNVTCSPSLASGAFCTATTYVDIENGGGGYARFAIDVHYVYRLFGTVFQISRSFTVKAYVWRSVTGYSIVLVSSGWRGGAEVYPNTYNATYVIELANRWPYSIEGINATLLLPHGFHHKHSSVVEAYVSGPVRSLQSFTTSFTLSIGSVEPGRYRALLVLSYVVDVGGNKILEHQGIYVYMTVHSIEWGIKLGYLPNVEPVLWFWGSTAPTTALTFSKFVPLTIELTNMGKPTASSVWIEVTPLNRSIRMEVPRAVCSPGLASGAFCRATVYADLGNRSGIAVFRIVVHYSYRVFGTVINISRAFTVAIAVQSFAGGRGLELVSSGWARGLDVYPNTYNATYTLTFANRWPYRIEGIDIYMLLPRGFTHRGTRIAHAYVSGPIESLQTFSVSIGISVGPVDPGTYSAKVIVRYVVFVGGSQMMWSEELYVKMVIHSVEWGIRLGYLPNVVPVEWFWGRAAPTTVFVDEKMVPLTVTLENVGKPAASGVVVEVTPLNSSVRMITSSSVCAATLASGGFCRATLYLDVGPRPGNLVFRLFIKYIYRNFGSVYTIVRVYTVSLPVMTFAGGKGLELVSSGWSNGWPVYPETQNATLSVTLANMWPYTVGGINLSLYLPPGFVHHGSRVVSAYVAGPVRSLQSFTTSFTITVENVSPGVYRARLVASYVVYVGGEQLRYVQSFVVNLRVESLRNAISVLTPSWSGAAPQPPVYGAILVVRVRDNYVPQMKGVVLEVELPKGFRCSLNNGSYAAIPAGVGPSMPAIRRAAMLSPQQVARYLASIAGGASAPGAAQSYGYGSVIEFYLPLNILVKRPGTYVIKGFIDFVDQWNNVRRVPIEIPVYVLGSARLIVVRCSNAVAFSNGTALLRVWVENVGSAPIYNVYVMLAPKSPLAIPVQNIKYVGTLAPGETKVVSYRLVYNPLNIVSAGGMAVQYQSVPMIVAVLYRDAAGYLHTMNVSIAVIVQPFIYIALGSDTHARLLGHELTISGTVINYGIVTAHSVWVYAYAGNSVGRTFVGDIDEASQAAFSISMDVNQVVHRIKLVVEYMDQYGRMHRRVFTLPVEVIPLNTTTTTTPSGFAMVLTPAHGAVIGGVAAFLAIVAFFIYRYLKRHSRAFSSSTSSGPELGEEGIGEGV